MKIFLPLFLLFFFVKNSQAQTIGTFTILPQPPTSTTPVKIATHITTNNLSSFISKSFTLSASNIINLELCYYEGMLTAIGNYVDTFAVGNLNPGLYTVQLMLNMSSTPNTCQPATTKQASTTFSVSQSTGLNELKVAESIRLYPNPVNNILVIEHSEAEDVSCSIKNAMGQVILEQNLARHKDGVDMRPLAPGIYFIELKSATGTRQLKVIRE